MSSIPPEVRLLANQMAVSTNLSVEWLEKRLMEAYEYGRASKKRTARETPKVDLRKEPFVNFAFETYHAKYQTLICDASDFRAVKELLAKCDAPLEELKRRWTLFLSSTKPFHREQGHPLRWFCQNPNAFGGNGNNGHHQESKDELVARSVRETADRISQRIHGAAADRPGGETVGRETRDLPAKARRSQ